MTPTRCAIVTDAASDVPAAERTLPDWVVLSDTWHPRGLEIVDAGEHSRELTNLAIVRRMPVVAPTVAAFTETFDALADHERVYSIHGSTRISEAADNANAAAVGRDNVLVVEASVAGIGVGLLAVRVQQLVAEGHAPSSIDAYVQRHARSVQFLAVPDNMGTGGRRRLWAASLLAGRRPIINTRGGELSLRRTASTRKATLGIVERYFREHAPEDRTIRLAIGHGDAAGAVDPLLDVLERIRPQATIELVGRVGPRLAQRLESRCVGVAWIVE